VLAPVATTAAAVLLTLHYMGSPEWLGGEEEARLERADFVERETGARWSVIGACPASASVTPRSDALAAPIATRDRSRRAATAAGPRLGAYWVPELQPKATKPETVGGPSEGPVCGICRDKAVGTVDQGLLAMQQVDRSSRWPDWLRAVPPIGAAIPALSKPAMIERALPSDVFGPATRSWAPRSRAWPP
jgi:hypothetical protein